MAEFEFKVQKHSVTGQDMVEIWRDKKMVAALYSDPFRNGLRIISKSLGSVYQEQPMVVEIELKEAA